MKTPRLYTDMQIPDILHEVEWLMTLCWPNDLSVFCSPKIILAFIYFDIAFFPLIPVICCTVRKTR